MRKCDFCPKTFTPREKRQVTCGGFSCRRKNQARRKREKYRNDEAFRLRMIKESSEWREKNKQNSLHV